MSQAHGFKFYIYFQLSDHSTHVTVWPMAVSCDLFNVNYVSSADIFLGMCPTTLLSHSFSYTSQQQRMVVVAACVIVYHGDSIVVLQ